MVSGLLVGMLLQLGMSLGRGAIAEVVWIAACASFVWHIVSEAWTCCI